MKDGDRALFEYIRSNLYVAAVCDVLDQLGFRNQAMHQRLRPLDGDCCIFVGRARTIQWMQTEYIVAEDPYGLEIDVMDSLREGDVVIHSTDFSGTNAPWGELMTTLARRNGAAGCVCDSQIRDCVHIKRMGFPVFCSGIRPLDSKGRARVAAFDVPVKCGEVLVNSGDLVFADFDGVVVIPQEAEKDAFKLAQEKAGAENLTRKELLEGKTLREVFDKYKVL